MTFTLSVTLAICLKLCPWMLKQSGEWLFQSVDEDEFHCARFFNLSIIAVLEGRTQTVIRNNFLRYHRAVRCQVKIITMDMFSPYYDLVKQLFPNAKIVLDCFHIVQHLSHAMSCVRVQIMNQFDRKFNEYKAIKRYWIVVNSAINIFIAILFVCTWPIKRF